MHAGVSLRRCVGELEWRTVLSKYGSTRVTNGARHVPARLGTSYKGHGAATLEPWAIREVVERGKVPACEHG